MIYIEKKDGHGPSFLHIQYELNQCVVSRVSCYSGADNITAPRCAAATLSTTSQQPLQHSRQQTTEITFEEEMDGNPMEQAVVSGIAFQRDEAKITLTQVPDVPGIASRILGPVARANIDVDMIVQNQSVNGLTDFSFTVNQNDFQRTLKVLQDEVVPGLGGGEVQGDPRIAKVSIVGLGMKSHAGIASRMFEALAKEGINIRMISTSEIKTSVVIEDKYLELAVRALHKAFGLEGEPATVPAA